LASRASALLVTLLLLTIVTTIVVLMFQAVTIDRRLASDFQKGVQARAISQFALDDAMQTLQSALNDLDDPFGATTAATNFWAVAPGRLDLFSLASGNSRPLRTSTIALHSGYDTSQELVDLNFTNASGTRAIWPGGLDMPVNWKPVLKNPAASASATNPVVGRYAFWVDDESSKVNINTADGTELYTQNSYGAGTPSAVQLGVALPSLSGTQIKEIVAAALANPFADISEVGRLPGTTGANALAAVRPANFILTEYSRSPEFNIFNEPRFQLASIWGGNRASDGTTVVSPGTPTSYVPASIGSAPNINTSRLPLDLRISLYPGTGGVFDARNFPARSIYPTPLQLTSNPNRSSFWPYLPAVASPADPSRRAGTLASVAKITNAVDSTANYAILGYNSVERFESARRLALYLSGTNANNQAITWPFAQANFTTKYSLRQLDSIIVQALDRVNLAIYGFANIPALLAPYGILGTDPVIGLGNTPKLCEMLYQFSWSPKRNSGLDDGGYLTPRVLAKGFLPVHYLNPISTDPANATGGLSNINGLNWLGTGGSAPFLQAFDCVPYTYPDRLLASFAGKNFPANPLLGYPGGPSYYANPWVADAAVSGGNTNAYMSYWGDSLLQAVDQNGRSAGIDFNMHPQTSPDPDPRAPLFRKDGMGTNPSWFNVLIVPPKQDWGGSAWAQGVNGGAAAVSAGTRLSTTGWNFQEAGYSVVRNWGFQWAYPTRDYYGTNVVAGVPQPLIADASNPYAQPVTSITLRGGFNYRVHRYGFEGFLEIVPFSAMAGPVNENTNRLFSKNLPDPNAVIPFPAGVTVSAATPTMYVHASVADPVVNKFPGDWTVSKSSTPPAHTLGDTGAPVWFYKSTTPNGSSTDMAASWGPIAMYLRSPVGNSISYNTISPTLNLPSVGSLQSIRTKMMPPDDAGNTDRGQPFRCLSLAGASDSTQTGIPDWALLDLMTVPQSVFDKPGSVQFSGATKAINRTYGGATSGKINPNGSVLFPWAETDASFIRPEPLTAVFANLRYNQDGNPANFTALSTTSAATLAGAVADYIRANGPLSLPGQICDIPAMNAYGASVNPTRNDIASQSIGVLDTRSCVFSVWVAAQAVVKKQANTDYGNFQVGDIVQGEKRYRYTVERYLDLGVDGVPGNANSPGPDNVVGTLDDPADDAYNPKNPKYKYRVINAQEIL
jgi:hypothetical protein